jgi:hypothetical protein
MTTYSIQQAWKVVTAGLAVATSIFATSAWAADASPSSMPAASDTSKQAQGDTWKDVATKTITANGVTFA